jgi:uncharacterized protein
MLAMFGGNTDLIGTLVKAGARVDESLLIFGTSHATPTNFAASFGDVPITRALLYAGADPNETDSDGFTLLYETVVNNHPDAARLLIERGSNVNAVDRRGMTPLLYAASADFGDSAMVDLLLKMGANPAARTREGLTAQGLARKYRHAYLTGSLTVAAR